eukprot:TRINITY_DN1248_c0_g1_i2.p2 TRINITY_DN1248_c0_g1~~TRINITY_DN1248_c0_g1_i2.p2  ORF type:complete len:103 (-),score=19.61 TRINITY_DN1248_c0_g1_i2:391-699(-)
MNGGVILRRGCVSPIRRLASKALSSLGSRTSQTTLRNISVQTINTNTISSLTPSTSSFNNNSNALPPIRTTSSNSNSSSSMSSWRVSGLSLIYSADEDDDGV